MVCPAKIEAIRDREDRLRTKVLFREKETCRGRYRLVVFRSYQHFSARVDGINIVSTGVWTFVYMGKHVTKKLQLYINQPIDNRGDLDEFKTRWYNSDHWNMDWDIDCISSSSKAEHVQVPCLLLR